MRAVLLAIALTFAFLAEHAAAAELGDRELAKQHFLEGEREYRLGRFERAIEAYSRAYERVPEPELLFNIAQCHRNLGRFERAVFFYRGYLREMKDATNRARVEKLIAELEAKIKTQPAAEDDPLAAKRTPPPPQQTAAIIPSAEPAIEDGDAMPVWPWIVGAAVVAVAGGTALAITLSRDRGPGEVEGGLVLDFRDR